MLTQFTERTDLIYYTSIPRDNWISSSDVRLRCDSPSLRPVRTDGAGSTGPASASSRATSDGDAAAWSGAYPADWPPGKTANKNCKMMSLMKS